MVTLFNVIDTRTGHLVYPLAITSAVRLIAQEVTTLLGNNNIYADSGNIEATYVAKDIY